MLNIDIVSGNDDGTLTLEVNGHSSNGNNDAKKGWGVHWRVRPDSNVAKIEAITIKTGPGAPPSTDIFSADPPAAQNGSNNRHWKGTVNSFASVGEEYNYDIKWIHTNGKHLIYDPKISVRP